MNFGDHTVWMADNPLVQKNALPNQSTSNLKVVLNFRALFGEYGDLIMVFWQWWRLIGGVSSYSSSPFLFIICELMIPWERYNRKNQLYCIAGATLVLLHLHLINFTDSHPPQQINAQTNEAVPGNTIYGLVEIRRKGGELRYVVHS